MLIQGISIHKGGPAGSTEELCLQRLGKGQTGGANGNSGKIREGRFANPAIVGKDEVKCLTGSALD
jgi:hypothetical protein